MNTFNESAPSFCYQSRRHRGSGCANGSCLAAITFKSRSKTPVLPIHALIGGDMKFRKNGWRNDRPKDLANGIGCDNPVDPQSQGESGRDGGFADPGASSETNDNGPAGSFGASPGQIPLGMFVARALPNHSSRNFGQFLRVHLVRVSILKDRGDPRGNPVGMLRAQPGCENAGRHQASRERESHTRSILDLNQARFILDGKIARHVRLSLSRLPVTDPKIAR